MGANLDIYEAQQRLKNSQESSGSFKKKVAKLKKKIEGSFQPQKPAGEKKEPEEVKDEMANPQDFVQVNHDFQAFIEQNQAYIFQQIQIQCDPQELDSTLEKITSKFQIYFEKKLPSSLEDGL